MANIILWNEQLLSDVTGQLSAKSRRIYRNDAAVFASWISDHGLSIEHLTRSDLVAYRSYLDSTYEKATAARMLSVARRILDEAVAQNILPSNPAKGIKGFRASNETPHTALNKGQAKDLLASIDRTKVLGMRDYALISLLLRTGLRRSECAALTIGNIRKEQGYHVIVIEHGKGDKRRVIKLPVDVFRALDDYLRMANRKRDPRGLSAPLFTGCTKGGQSTMTGISDKLIERVVIAYGEKIGVPDLTPHGLRATFITLAIEGGATLIQAQYAAGHSDPRTTERYQGRKLNLDDNAVDYIKL